MFQFIVSTVPGADWINESYVCLLDQMRDTTYRPLVKLTSQQTGKVKVYNSAALLSEASNARYYKINTILLEVPDPNSTDPVTPEAPASGSIRLGNNQDYPLGFYDMSIYENTATSFSSLDPDDAPQPALYKGVVYVNNNRYYRSVNYYQYNCNDSATDSVYITNSNLEDSPYETPPTCP